MNFLEKMVSSLSFSVQVGPCLDGFLCSKNMFYRVIFGNFGPFLRIFLFNIFKFCFQNPFLTNQELLEHVSGEGLGRLLLIWILDELF